MAPLKSRLKPLPGRSMVGVQDGPPGCGIATGVQQARRHNRGEEAAYATPRCPAGPANGTRANYVFIVDRGGRGVYIPCGVMSWCRFPEEIGPFVNDGYSPQSSSPPRNLRHIRTLRTRSESEAPQALSACSNMACAITPRVGVSEEHFLQ